MLVLTLEQSDPITIDGPATIYLKETKQGKAVLLFDVENNVTVLRKNAIKREAGLSVYTEGE